LEFLDFSDAEWARKEAGPYVIVSRADGNLLGCTGLELETSPRAATGYVLAKDAQHQGYATEMLNVMCETAGTMGIVRLYAVCHPDNAPSWKLLERCGFVFEGLLHKHTIFPNLGDGGLCDVLSYVRIL
jgi:ribosomal-protein-alanine N-acetyltransferase